MKISVNEVLEALQVAAAQDAMRPKPDNGFTSGEMNTAMGWNFHQGRKALLAFKAAGLITAGRATRLAVDDTYRPVPVYRFVKPKKAK